MKHHGMFEHFAKVTMNEIMEKYLLYIYSKFLEYDPLSSVDYVEEYTRTIDSETSSTGKSNSQSNSTSSGLGISNDTPQTNITKQNLETGAYASNVTQSDSNAEANDETRTESEGSGKTLEKYTHSMKGDNGVIVTNQYLVREFRELAINIDEEIMGELNKRLFLCIY